MCVSLCFGQDQRSNQQLKLASTLERCLVLDAVCEDSILVIQIRKTTCGLVNQLAESLVLTLLTPLLSVEII